MIEYSFPDATLRENIWRRIFPSDTATYELDYRKLAQLNAAGGNIRNIALNVTFIAKDCGEPVMMKHILSPTISEYKNLEMSFTNQEIRGWV